MMFFAAFVLMFTLVIQSNGAKAQNFQEGRFYRELPTNKIYWMCMGKLRHVVTGSTLGGLFKNSGNYLENVGKINDIMLGFPLGPDNGLIRDTNTGKVYFLRDGVIIYIQTPAAFDQYHFNADAIRDITGVAGYQTCYNDLPYVLSGVHPGPCWK